MSLACLGSQAANPEFSNNPMALPQASTSLDMPLVAQLTQSKATESIFQKSVPLPCEDSKWRGLKLGVEDFKSRSLQAQLSIIKSVQAQESTCLKSAAFYAELGQWQLLAHQAKDALEALERSLLIEPEQPSVQLDFALALAESGDPVSARALADQILLRPDLPNALRTTLEQIKGTNQGSKSLSTVGIENGNAHLQEKALSQPSKEKRVLSLLGSDWETQGSTQFLYGHDTNLNSASFVNTINLTLPNGTVPLSLDVSSLPQSGPTVIGAAQVLAQTSMGDKNLSVGASWMGRLAPANTSLGFNNEELSLQLRPDKDVGLHHRMVFNHFEIGGSNFYNGFAYLMWAESEFEQGIKAPWANTLKCRLRAGGETERRTYAQDATQNGLFGGLMLGGFCGNEQDQFNLSWVGGMDWASDASRAGGNQRRQEVKASWVHAGQNSKLSAEWAQQWLSDTQIYSDLLGGINRNTLRKSTRLSYQYKMSNKLGMMLKFPFWVSYWESQRYSSSVDLFNLRGDSVQTGLKWDF